jgi:hypothetical protein
VGLLVLCAAWFAIYLFSFLYLQNQELQTWTSRLTAATLGSYLTAILVDKSFRDKERREEVRIRNTALEELRIPLNAHLNHLTSWYTASLSEQPDEISSSWMEFLNSDYVDTVQKLDFSSSTHTTDENKIGLAYSSEHMKEFQNDVNSVATKYSHAMDSEMVHTLQELATSQMVSTIINMHRALPEIERLEGKKHAKDITGELALVINDDVEDHISNLMSLIEYYDESDAPDIAPFEGTSLHSANVAPQIGSARLDLEIISENDREDLTEE